MKEKPTISPILQKLKGRAPAASNLWAKANKARIDELAQGKSIGHRQKIVAQMWGALPKEERDHWEAQVAELEEKKKADPEAPFMYDLASTPHSPATDSSTEIRPVCATCCSSR